MTEHLVYGLHAVRALLANAHRRTKIIYCNEDRADKRLQEVLSLAQQQQIPIERLSAHKMNLRFSDVAHQGIVASASPLAEYSERNLAHLLSLCRSPCLILILDGVTDPHNLGACLRSADAALVDFVMVPKDNNAHVTPVVSKVASGAAESVPLVRVTNLVRAMEVLKKEGVWIYGADGGAEDSIYQLDSSTSMAIVMGAEGRGMRRLTREQCDGTFAIPMLGTVSSLNVSVATGICLFEVVRKRTTSLQTHR